MSLLGKIAAALGGGSTGKVCVVDGDRMAGGDRVGPGERFSALSKLARFAAREELKASIVFSGRALREAADGDNYDGVDVYFGETSEDARNRIVKVARSSGKAVVITSDNALEQELTAQGISTMRLSTLRKAMETSAEESSRGGNSSGGDRSSGSGRDGSGRRSRGRGRGRGGRGGRGGDRQGRSADSSGAENAASSSPASDGDDNAGSSAPRPRNDASVKNLIDLVE
jgi:hypothetical protein